LLPCDSKPRSGWVNLMRLRRPTAERVARFVARQRQHDFTYPHVGATAAGLPTGYVIDRHRVLLGSGQAVFSRGAEALRQWRHFELGWLRASPVDVPPRQGVVVAVIAQVWQLWWLNACRVVYTVDESEESDSIQRFG